MDGSGQNLFAPGTVPVGWHGNDGMGALTGRHGRSSSGARPLARSSQNRSRRIRYCWPVPVRRGLRRAAQPGTPRTGECICTRQQRHTRWGKACPSSPPPPRETHAHALQTDGSGGNDDSREDMHGETQSSRRRTQRWGGLAACHCQRDSSSGQKVAVARHRATEPSTNAQLQHTRYCACAWSI